MMITDNVLDGNAAAGPLLEIFSVDLTAAHGRCEKCGRVCALAETVLYDRAPGLVVRCAGCEAVLLRLVDSGSRLWLDLRGLSYLQIDR
jgi:NAD-dependent SIR2 family protein deacetylase